MLLPCSSSLPSSSPEYTLLEYWDILSTRLLLVQVVIVRGCAGGGWESKASSCRKEVNAGGGEVR